MAVSKRKNATQEDLRRLMKGKQYEAKIKNSKKIEHPLAKYNTLDQLVCVLCQCVIKTDFLWTAHIQSKQHKEKFSSLKSKTESKSIQLMVKRKADNSELLPSKKHKENIETKNVPRTPSDLLADSQKKKPQSVSETNKLFVKKPATAEYSSSEEENELKGHTKITASTAKSGSVPTDFFDRGVTPSMPEAESTLKQQNIPEALPEGFFDDPKLDAKVRQVEYRDKMDDEWELFQRAMKEETHVSEAIMAEEDEQVTVDRNIDEIDEQIHRWQEINDLQNKKDEIMENKPEKSDKDNLDSDDELDETELQEFLNWRSKKSWK